MPKESKKWKAAFLLGATSEISQELCYFLAKDCKRLYLAARNPNVLKPLQSDLELRFAIQVNLIQADVLDAENSLESVKKTLSHIDLFVCVTGYLGSQKKAQSNVLECLQIINTNYTGLVCILNFAAEHFKKKRKGMIVGISSVAGERGRQSNYFYGSAKAAFTAYLSGLRGYLHPFGVHVMTVLPGFVKTKMIAGKNPPALITSTPRITAKHIYKAMKTKKNIVYTKPIWKWIMFIIKSIPEPLFKRLKI